jgi:hypothetical protein
VGTLLLKHKERPRRTYFCTPVTDKLDAESTEYNPDLEGDGLGRMAHLVQAYTPVMNQMMWMPGLSAFYDRVLSCGRWWGEPVFLMRYNNALKFFPTEDLGVRVYASTGVPVAVENTEEFAKASGYTQDHVSIFVATEFVPGLGSFLRFVEVMSKVEFVASSDPNALPMPVKMPLFRHDRAYNVDADLFREAVLNESR